MDEDPSQLAASFAAILAGVLVGPFHLGIGGPGGFTILVRPSVRLGDEVLVPDLAAWSAERAPSPTDEPCTSLIPDWVCEVRSLRAPARDFSDKTSAYAREGVRFMWILDPADQTMALFKLDAQRRWELSGAYSASHGPSRVRGEPFDAIEVDLALLFRR